MTQKKSKEHEEPSVNFSLFNFPDHNWRIPCKTEKRRKRYVFTHFLLSRERADVGKYPRDLREAKFLQTAQSRLWLPEPSVPQLVRSSVNAPSRPDRPYLSLHQPSWIHPRLSFIFRFEQTLWLSEPIPMNRVVWPSQKPYEFSTIRWVRSEDLM